MVDFKKLIGEKIANATQLDIEEIINYIEIPPNKQMGDYAFPCFKLAKTLRKAPPAIATEISEKIKTDDNIERVEVVGGYLNFYINKLSLTKIVLEEIDAKSENYGANDTGKDTV